MAIPTSRTKENSSIEIDESLCTGCGLCVQVCSDFSLKMTNDKAAISQTPMFGCFGCGHCMMICPVDAIQIAGRATSPDYLFKLTDKNTIASYDQFLALLHRRRSIREFKGKPVEPVIIQKIITAAQTAPSGFPPSDVHVLVFDTKEKIENFARDYCTYLENMKWMVSKWFLAITRFLFSRAEYESFKSFAKPLFDGYTLNMRKGINYVTYSAPAAIYFYGTPYGGPNDPIIAATLAMLAAESLNLGSCMIGGIHPMIQRGKKARLLREKYGIRYASKPGIFVIFGYPAIQYKMGITRSFARVDYVN